ncbi:hypothetical protein E0K83_03895 [Gramella sp. BOM4]|nr:hypothetical protein [Christiangramia bathymodioli]
MKFFKHIWLCLLLLSAVEAPAQGIYTSRPDLVYPILEEFVAENYKNDTRSLEKLSTLDSVMFRNLPLRVVDTLVLHDYGLHYSRGGRHWIELDSILLEFPFEFNKVLKHELGHVFGLDHIPTHDLPKNDPKRMEIMSSYHAHYMLEWKYEEDPELWKRVNDNYYKSLKLKSPQQ